jgi:hypothetical protein
MTSIGSVDISLRLDRTQFNQDLRELQRLKLDCLPIKLCPDFDSFNRELKKQLSGQYAVTLGLNRPNTREAVTRCKVVAKALQNKAFTD